MTELRRILLSKRTILFLLIAMLVCVMFFLYDCKSEKQITLAGQELYDYINGYPEFLQSVEENAKSLNTIAALSGGYSQKNINKTASDYAALSDVKPILGENKGFVLLSGYLTGDIIIISVTLLIAALFTEERKKGLAALIRSTTNGRYLLSVQRVFVIIVTALITSVLVHSSCFLVASLSCGNMDVLRPIQSVPEFSLCTFKITILDYLFYSVLIKALSASVFGLLLYLISSVFESAIAFILCTSAVVTEYILFSAILPTDKSAILKFCNIAALVRTDVFFNKYCNLNIFGTPVGFLNCSLMVITVIFAILCTFCILFTSKRISEQTIFSKITQNIARFFSRKSPAMPLYMWEIKKIFINHKGAVILAVIIYIAASSSLQYSYVLPSYTPSQEKFYHKYEGQITTELYTQMNDDLAQLQLRYDTQRQRYLDKLDANGGVQNGELIDMYNRLMDIGDDIIALEELIKTVDNGLLYTSQTGISIEFIKPKLYELLLLEDTATTNKNALYIMLAVICIFSGICANEKHSNMNFTLRSLSKGRKTLTMIKLLIIGVTSIILTATVFAPQVMLIGNEGYNNLSSTAQSLEFLRFIPFEISILWYLIIVFLIRTFATFTTGCAVMLISRFSKNSVTALCISTLILIVPAVLSDTDILTLPSILDAIGFCVIN